MTPEQRAAIEALHDEFNREGMLDVDMVLLAHAHRHALLDYVKLLEAALDSVMPCPALTLWPIPAHLAPILEESRKRIIGSAGTGTGSDKI